MKPDDQVVENDDGSFTVKILHPYEPPGASGEKLSEKAIQHLSSEEVEEVRIGKIYGRHLIAIDNVQGTNEQVMRLAHEISGVPYRVFLRMHESDLGAITRAIMRQRGKSHASGGGP